MLAFLKCSFLDEVCYCISLLPWASCNILKAPQEDHTEPDNWQHHGTTSALWQCLLVPGVVLWCLQAVGSPLRDIGPAAYRSGLSEHLGWL